MKTVKPDEFFRLDFDQILEEGKRQEKQLKENIGEYKIVKDIHEFFFGTVLPLINSNEWVYNAALEFATNYALDCVDVTRLASEEISNAQNQLFELKKEVKDIIERAKVSNYLIHFTGSKELEKTSDFITLLRLEKMTNEWRIKVKNLYERVVDREKLYIWIAIRAIRDVYETNLPRIMYVVKRAIKVRNQIPPKQSDELLCGISEDITWYERYIQHSHPLFPVMGYLSSFYKIVRNVANHHKGFEWLPEKNLVILEDDNGRIEITSSELIQRMRYLTIYVCDLGLRGILSGFCNREKGEISNNLVREYIKIFPDNWGGGEIGKVQFY